ncbi:MAG: TonB-dependent receptor [Pseudomonadota bacterium]
MFRRKSGILLAGCSCAALLTFAAPALAQETPDTVADQGPAAGEIIVTANKREQNLNTVGLSVAALSGDALTNQRIGDVADLARVTPGLTFAPSPNATPVYTLRGVGFFESSLGAYPNVSLYIDQVPLPFPIYSTLTAFDLQRVETLKGPQGTLFGNNATGGAINFVPAKPTSTLTAGGELTYGRFNLMEGQAFISGPITDTLRARVAIKASQADGWQYSYTRDDRNGKKDNLAVRGIVDWKPTEALSVELNLNMWRDRSDPQAPATVLRTPQNDTSGAPAGPGAVNWTPGYVWPVTAYPLAPNNNRAADWTPGVPFADNRFRQAALRVDYDFGPVALTSLTGLSDLKFRNGTEGGGTALDDLDLHANNGDMRSFTQELRLSNGAGSPFRWVIGGNYENSHVSELINLRYDDTTSTYVNGIVVSTYTSDQRMRNYAGFANVEFDVTEQITLKGGYRRTKAKRDYRAFNGDIAGYTKGPGDNFPLSNEPGLDLTDFFNAVYGAIYGAGTVPTIAPFGSIILDTRTGPDGTLDYSPSTFLTAIEPTGRLNENSDSWSVGVDFKPVPGVLLYANVAKGFKAGSFGTISGAIVDAYRGVTQESLIDYEVGYKLQLFDRKLSVNGAFFWYDYKNKQLRAKFVDPIFGALDQLVNIPKSTVKGAEIEVNARPMDGLTLSASAVYLDAKVKEYTGVVGLRRETTGPMTGLLVPILDSFEGRRLPFAPELQYTARIDYDRPITDQISGFFGIGLSGQTKSSGVLTTLGVEPAEVFDIKGYTLVDGNIGIHAADDSWRVSVWGKNIFNKNYNTNVIQAYDHVVRYTGMPTTFGVTVGFKIN